MFIKCNLFVWRRKERYVGVNFSLQFNLMNISQQERERESSFSFFLIYEPSLQFRSNKSDRTCSQNIQVPSFYCSVDTNEKHIWDREENEKFLSLSPSMSEKNDKCQFVWTYSVLYASKWSVQLSELELCRACSFYDKRIWLMLTDRAAISHSPFSLSLSLSPCLVLLSYLSSQRKSLFNQINQKEK